jgi:hypothetical protein
MNIVMANGAGVAHRGAGLADRPVSRLNAGRIDTDNDEGTP